MAKFAKNIDTKAVAKQQAANVMMRMQGDVLKSVRTVGNYEERLAKVAERVNAQFNCSLRDLSFVQAHQYLTDRAVEVGQKTLDMERQAIQAMMQNVSGKLAENKTLAVIQSEHAQILNSRSYAPHQIQMVMEHQREKNALSTEICYAAGVRTHEMYTLLPRAERDPSDRPALAEKFSQREGIIYTVEGKGGLIREVLIPHHLAERLEARRLEQPVQIIDRGVIYSSHYDVNGGHRLSIAFNRASNAALGWSRGIHGTRHSYAQERMDELRKEMPWHIALEVVSQELGHFRPEITEVYLR